MKIKIDDKILSIPPYISTKWSNIAAIHMKGNVLVVTLNDGESINIPGLPEDIVDAIFSHHSTFLEKEPAKETNFGTPMFFGGPGEGADSAFKLNFNSLENMGTAMQHNPAQADAPDLPPEILEKIAAISKIVRPDDPNLIPKAEPHCNCMHCQISRAIAKGANDDGKVIEPVISSIEEEVKVEDLTFQQWDVKQAGDQLFTVTNRLDNVEHYNVFLGNPVGCTCGKQGCEHIIAVLKS
jgi:hypothetical protein